MTAPVVLLFPGQGSQFVGMGQSLCAAEPAARAVYAEADEALGFGLAELCWSGPEDRLTRTEFAQPAILTHSIAALRVAEARGGWQATAVAGHSLGEWTALVAAGALSLADAVRLVHLRGQLMQEAVPVGVGAMSAVLGLDRALVEAACAEAVSADPVSADPVSAGTAGAAVVVVATHNDAANLVISGHAGAVARAGALCVARGALRALPLPVSAPFHSPLMAPAALRLAEHLTGIRFAPLQIPVRSTIVDQLLEGQPDWRGLLTQQMCDPVLWQEAVAAMVAGGAQRALALGPAVAVPGLVKRTSRALKVRVLCEYADFAEEI